MWSEGKNPVSLVFCVFGLQFLFHWFYLSYDFCSSIVLFELWFLFQYCSIWAMISVPVLFYLSYDFCSSIVLFKLWFLFQYCSIWVMISVPVLFYLSYDFCSSSVLFELWFLCLRCFLWRLSGCCQTSNCFSYILARAGYIQWNDDVRFVLDQYA